MKTIDHLDRAILEHLNLDARQSFADIGKQVGISGPAVGERVRRLKDNGVIDGFGVGINLRALGYTLQALVRIKPRSGELHKVEKLIAQQPRFMSCERVTGDDCFVAKLALTDVPELDDVLLPLHDCAETHTSIIKSHVIEPRLPPLIPD